MTDFDVREIWQFIKDSPSKTYPGILSLRGLAGSAVYFPVASLFKKRPGKIHVLIKDDSTEASYAVADLTVLLGYEHVYLFPASYRGTGKTARDDESFQVQRITALRAVAQYYRQREDIILVTYPKALKEGIPAVDFLESESLDLETGISLSHQDIKEYLFKTGFEKTDFVSEPGQFAIRGSIIDVFSYSENRPFRINFFGDRIENIRIFDQNSQLSVEERQVISITPRLQGNESLLPVIAPDTLVWSFLETFREIPPEIPQIAMYPLLQEGPAVRYDTTPQPSFNKNFVLLVNDIHKRKDMGYQVFILSENQAQIRRLEEVFHSLNCPRPFVKYKKVSLHEGFSDHLNKICYYTDHQLFQRIHRVYLKRSVLKSERITVNDLTGFKVGDYVVHIDHGVGVFGGLVKTNINGKVQEAVKLIYRDNDVLYVNIHGLHRIARYKSKDSAPPRIYKLGSGAWNRIKQQTKKKVKDIARDLINLYSQRLATKGFAFSQDTYLQNQLEASFLFEDTPDQLLATQQVKSDMEKPYPMDRLICGDVGFGKTEIAIRAAFKAVTDGKQAAFLVPTTILALQHYHTISERLADFPVKIDFISRLKTPAQTKEILRKLREGTIDIIIGTHRLLNKDVQFKDLGLLIIDEEQKFGVAAKEKLKLMKINIDTLTMTATPIPRTLQFSLMGARDLSIIQTPPSNRLPIHTEIQIFDDDIIREAIDRELDRGGQIFFIHNRITDIEAVADMLRKIRPGLRIATGHGQIPPKTMEKVLLDFICGDYDLLLATSIIENGIDIPNANTIIINRAHRFGLSDLHQMRGRVGRSNRKAYCYLLVPRDTSLTEDANRRLKALESFTELGSGFNIAMQDLDIRGAGNLLGGEQSGFIAEMGFETYQRILEEAFAELNQDTPALFRTTPVPSFTTSFVSDCTIETDLEVMIPDEYISQVSEKIRLYKELDNMKEESRLQEFFTSLEDRFGPIPEPFRQLGYVVRLRRLAVQAGFERIVLKNGIMLAYFISDPQSDYYRTELFANILKYISSHPGNFQVKEQKNKLFVKIPHVKSIEAAYNFLKIFAKP
ncbi:MAG: transcription-repair coupling factor [Bacteroidales bacterium]|jgi:transcription-repair coupling factor (superfamily II helicase)|nr:transcription-repair coupling factor [Bacteroidales bacterium]MDD2263426.1 transcription-repair coupling factor [Bacteroidales bacterium]MDD2830784.1 transcription-repair coupling factor [Bacteroidales bacterium]MDD3207983.1 transcription-repair coupling factor [Bacteroidales bacterium]MDD3696510.1 transcription-repair coupling factor [Bacteroidales bacterium]